MAMGKANMQNMHLPLPESVYSGLRAEARRAGRPATELAREAISNWLDDRQRRHQYEAIQSYAKKVAGGPEDLDTDLEAAGCELLLTQVSSSDDRP